MSFEVFEVVERESRRLAGKLVDELGAAIPGSAIVTLTLTCFSLHSPALAIVNGRNKQNALNVNGVTVDASGNYVWQLDPLDTQVLDATLPKERHRALLEGTYAGGAKAFKDVTDFDVRTLEYVP